ncbi:FAD/NAD(P)-binding protein [Tsukamurella pseudospumae]|uniref:FAD/NAD(P)-binding protein n=1 Tax=Tsukamurella pseudospumae TaxID=239498 RepID=UPI0009EBF9AE|nr:FAD/NAD(P)-binding protein [Tsukamurella pseudospumae]
MVRVAIIGGGFAGASVVSALADTAPGADLVVYSPSDILESSAFHTDGDGRLSGLTNTDLDTFSLGQRSLTTRLRAITPPGSNFCKRTDVGRTIKEHLESVTFSLRTTTMVSYHKTNDGKIVVTGNDGSQQRFDHIVLCRGYSDPAIPVALRQLLNNVPSSSAVLDPYAPSALSQVAPSNLIVGMGPTAVDTALALCARGEPCHLVSRSGLFPAVKLASPRGSAVTQLHYRLPRPSHGIANTDWANSVIRAIDSDSLLPVQPGVDDTNHAGSVLNDDIDAALSTPISASWSRHCLDLIDTMNTTFRGEATTIAPDLSRALNALCIDNALQIQKFLEIGLLTTSKFDASSIGFTRHGYTTDGHRFFKRLVLAAGRGRVRSPIQRSPIIHRIGAEDPSLPIVNGVHILSASAVTVAHAICGDVELPAARRCSRR